MLPSQIEDSCLPQTSFDSGMGYRRNVLNLGVIGEEPAVDSVKYGIAYTDTLDTGVHSIGLRQESRDGKKSEDPKTYGEFEYTGSWR